MHQTEADGDSSDDDYSEVDNNDFSAAETLCWIAQLNTVFNIHICSWTRHTSCVNVLLAEYLSFPTIFCGKVRLSNNERWYKVYMSEIFKYDLHATNTCVALNIPNIFRKSEHLQIQHILQKVSLAVRHNKTKG